MYFNMQLVPYIAHDAAAETKGQPPKWRSLFGLLCLMTAIAAMYPHRMASSSASAAAHPLLQVELSA